MCSSQKNFSKKLKMFWYRIKLALYKLAKDPPAKSLVVLSFHKCHQICVIFQYIVVLTPLGLHIQTCKFLFGKERPVGSRVYIPICLPVALDKDGGSLLLCLCCVLVRLKTFITGFTYYYWCYCNDYLFCTMVLSTDPGNGTDTQKFCFW
jgi:hypothetical protein